METPQNFITIVAVNKFWIIENTIWKIFFAVILYLSVSLADYSL